MAERHLDRLFAEACDGLLDQATRRRFDTHLDGCDRCRGAFADHCAVREALGGVPSARMPVPVRLPLHAPRAPRAGLAEWLAGRLRGRGWQTAGALTGLAAAATAVLLVVAHTGGGGAPQVAEQAGGGGAGFSGPGTGALAPAERPQPTGQHDAAPGGAALAPVAGVPSGFDNRVSVSLPARPGQTLVVATQSKAYSAGARVNVFAALAVGTPNGPAGGFGAGDTYAVGITPLVELRAATGGTSGSSPEPAGGEVLDVAAAQGGGLYSVTIPATVPAGATVVLLVTVPAGLPSAGDIVPITAQLTLTVG